MAVVQISRIQIRRGQTGQTGFPQLASGEFGWSVDQQELYIGNGSVAEGAPAVGNSRILTEHDGNFFLLSNSNYIYSNTANGPTVQTGPVNDPFISRTQQSRLDDRINLRTFGAVGDGVADDTGAIQRAVFHASQSHKPLDINEGVFLVSAEIEVPANVTIRGAGTGKSVIVNSSTSSIFRTVGTDISGNIVPIASAVYVPKNIKISGVTFQSSLTNASSMVKFDSVSDGLVEECEFVGNPAIASTSTMAAGFDMVGNIAVTCDNVQVSRCIFRNLGTAIKSNYDIKNIGIFYNKFNNVDGGVILNQNLKPGNYYGADYVDVSRNVFNNVNNQALYVGSNIDAISHVRSSHNEYINAGVGYNNSAGELHPATEVILFRNGSCHSESDSFGRIETLNNQPLSNFTNILPVILGPSTFVIENPVGGPVALGSNFEQLFAFPRVSYTVGLLSSSFQTFIVNYTVTKYSPYVTRQGVLTITVDNSANTVDVTDNFTYQGANDGSIVFTADISKPNVIVVNYNNNAGSGIISYSLEVRQ